jgi:putative ABC transport system permease protein
MTSSVQAISVWGLVLSFIPALVVLIILIRWAEDAKGSVYALARMLIQLLLVGYVLTFIFTTQHAVIIGLVLSVMLIAASWISLRPLKAKQPLLYLKAFAAIVISGVPILALVTQLVVDVEPWFQPRYVVPLAGMIFASSMNTLSLAAERYEAETGQAEPYLRARNTAMQASLIPTINSMLAVGLVSLPGMMTGQILSGTPPLIAVKYQIVVMCMVFGASGISAAVYLSLLKPKAHQPPTTTE